MTELAEINKFRADIPAEIRDLSPVLYDYLRELAIDLREFGTNAVTGSLTLSQVELETRYFRQEYPLGVETKALVNNQVASVTFVEFGYDAVEGNLGQLTYTTPEMVVALTGQDSAMLGVDYTKAGVGSYGWVLNRGIAPRSTPWVAGEIGQAVYLADGELTVTPSGLQIGLLVDGGISLSQTRTAYTVIPPDLTEELGVVTADVEAIQAQLANSAEDLEFLRQLVDSRKDASELAIARLESANANLDIGGITRTLAELKLTQAGYDLRLRSVTTNVDELADKARQHSEASYEFSVSAKSSVAASGFWAEVSERRSLDALAINNDTVAQATIATEAAVSASDSAAAAATSASVTAGIVADQSAQIATINSTLTTHATDIAANASSITSLNSSVTGINSTLASHTTQINTATSTNTAQAASITSLNSSVTSINSTLSSHTTTINSHTTSISSLTTDTTALTSTVNGHTATLTTQAATNATVAGKLAAYWQVDAVAGGRAQLKVWADANGGGGVDIIGDVSISGNLLVAGTITTGKLADDSVTDVQQAYNGSNAYGAGMSTWVTVASFSVTLAQAGDIIALSTQKTEYTAGEQPTKSRLTIDGVEVAFVEGNAYSDSVALSGKSSLAAGTYTVQLQFKSNGSGEYIPAGLGSLITIRRYK